VVGADGGQMATVQVEGPGYFQRVGLVGGLLGCGVGFACGPSSASPIVDEARS
jgi:hypothetical protein